MIKKLAMAAAACALLTACGGGTEDPAPEDATQTAAVETPGVDLENPGAELVPTEKVPASSERTTEYALPNTSIDHTSKHFTAAANIDGQIASFSRDLSERIHAEVKAEIESAKGYAEEDADDGSSNPHDYQADFIKTASVGDIISIESLTMTYAGGAHPNYVIGGIIHDRASGNDLPASAMLSADGEAAMKAFLMEELAKAKVKRMSMEAEDLPILREEVSDVFPKEIEFWLGQVTLAPSFEDGKFGGMIVHYSPYDVGAYAEGSYDILVEASALSSMLNETYAPMFGGEPDVEEHEEH